MVTGIIDPIVTGTYGPIEGNVNQTLGALSVPLLGLVGLPGALSVDVNGLLTTAGVGDDIGLSVLASDGTLIGPSDQCDATADSFTLDTPAGIAIGGNQITGWATRRAGDCRRNRLGCDRQSCLYRCIGHRIHRAWARMRR